jgi:hypothetical protein
MTTRLRLLAGASGLALLLAGCGSSNPLDNPDTLDNPAVTTGQKLSFAYYQKCINPIFLAQLTINQNGQRSINTCASAGCHDNTNGTGGAFRLVGAASAVDLTQPANTPDTIRASDMYKNFYSAQGEVLFGAPLQSRLVAKPLVLNVLHGGGLIFESQDDPNVKLLSYWIDHPMPQGHDEFSPAASAMFDALGDCKS